jgi:hypothetical protein
MLSSLCPVRRMALSVVQPLAVETLTNLMETIAHAGTGLQAKSLCPAAE